MATLKFKRSTTPGAAPSSLSEGELALNLADKRIFTANSSVVFDAFQQTNSSITINTNGNAKLSVGNTTVNTTVNSTSISVANLQVSSNLSVINVNSLSIGNTTVKTTVNSICVNINGANATVAANTSDYLGKTNATKALTSNAVWQAMVVKSLTDAATITPNFANGIDFEVTLGGNRTLANPSNVTVGQRGRIQVKQDATGSRTLTYGTSYKWAGGTAGTLSTAANAIDFLDYDVVTTTFIRLSLSKDWK